MSALTSLILVLFLLLIALAVVAWLTLTARERAERAREAREAREARNVQAPPRRPRPDVSNDRVRGAKAPVQRAPADTGLLVPPGEPGARVRPRRTGGEDAFERFLDPDRRRDGGDR